MARIDRSEYPTIAQFIADGTKVPELAAQFQCTPANIYLILSRIRDGQAGPAAAKLLAKIPGKGARLSPRKGKTSEPGTSVAAPIAGAAVTRPSEASPAGPLVLAPTPPLKDQSLLELALPPEPPPTSEIALQDSRGQDFEAPTVAKATATSSEPVDRGRRDRTARSNATPKQAVGLVMRTSSGDEAIHPFRSIEDLLSAVKPLLRTASKSPEPIWFSIQNVDLVEFSID